MIAHTEMVDTAGFISIGSAQVYAYSMQLADDMKEALTDGHPSFFDWKMAGYRWIDQLLLMLLQRNPFCCLSSMCSSSFV